MITTVSENWTTPCRLGGLWLFYGTIIWAAVYLWYYHVSDKGPNQEQEYIAAMEMGEAEKAKFLATQADAIDEKTVTMFFWRKLILQKVKKYILPIVWFVMEQMVKEPLVLILPINIGYMVAVLMIYFTTIKYGVPEKGYDFLEGTASAWQLCKK
jgi:cytochrome c oxidase cbb3-type subunit 3